MICFCKFLKMPVCIFFTLRQVKMNILANGNVGIGAPTPDTISQIFQVGDGGKLRISNNANAFTQIGTEDGVYTTKNAKIFISGNTCSTAGNNGGI
jgi:hypothetical protein